MSNCQIKNFIIIAFNCQLYFKFIAIFVFQSKGTKKTWMNRCFLGYSIPSGKNVEINFSSVCQKLHNICTNAFRLIWIWFLQRSRTFRQTRSFFGGNVNLTFHWRDGIFSGAFLSVPLLFAHPKLPPFPKSP